jgi:hypothetical protein
MSRDQMSKLLDSCESRLLESLCATQEVLDQLRQIRISLMEQQTDHGRTIPLPNDQREKIVQAVLDAMGSAGESENRDLILLVRNQSDGTYGIGRRRLNLTETETQIMDLFWSAKPEPVSRNELHASLYPGVDKPNAGVIDVFLSKLRQKLKLASNGREHLESIRGRGWALRSGLCRTEELR